MPLPPGRQLQPTLSPLAEGVGGLSPGSEEEVGEIVIQGQGCQGVQYPADRSDGPQVPAAG